MHRIFCWSFPFFTNLISLRQTFAESILFSNYVFPFLPRFFEFARHKTACVLPADTTFFFHTWKVNTNASQQSGAMWESEQPVFVSSVKHQLISCLPAEERKTLFQDFDCKFYKTSSSLLVNLLRKAWGLKQCVLTFQSSSQCCVFESQVSLPAAPLIQSCSCSVTASYRLLRDAETPLQWEATMKRTAG